MGVDCGDYDNDGRLDLFMTDYQGKCQSSIATWAGDCSKMPRAGRCRRSCVPHVNWGAGLVDFDNDGDRDLFIACGHLHGQHRSSSTTATRSGPEHPADEPRQRPSPTCPTAVAAGWPWSKAAKAPASTTWTTTAISTSSSSTPRAPLCSATTSEPQSVLVSSSGGTRAIATASAPASQSSPAICPGRRSAQRPRLSKPLWHQAPLRPGTDRRSIASRSAGSAAEPMF